jgi:hypothetical protein
MQYLSRSRIGRVSARAEQIAATEATLGVVLREEWPRITWPGYPMDFSPFVFFGFSSGDRVWGIRWQGPSEIIAYHHNMEDEYERLGLDILDVYRRDYSSYQE